MAGWLRVALIEARIRCSKLAKDRDRGTVSLLRANLPLTI